MLSEYLKQLEEEFDKLGLYGEPLSKVQPVVLGAMMLRLSAMNDLENKGTEEAVIALLEAMAILLALAILQKLDLKDGDTFPTKEELTKL